LQGTQYSSISCIWRIRCSRSTFWF